MKKRFKFTLKPLLFIIGWVAVFNVSYGLVPISAE